jgi:hypothetical protein
VTTGVKETTNLVENALETCKKFQKKLSPQCTNSHQKEEMLIPTQYWFETGLYYMWYPPNTHLKLVIEKI